jgi:hypothetical protein
MAKAGLDQAAPITVARQYISAPDYPIRRSASERDDDTGTIAALRQRTLPIPHASLPSSIFVGTVRDHWLAVNAA